jgi:hypothetical protein
MTSKTLERMMSTYYVYARLEESEFVVAVCWPGELPEGKVVIFEGIRVPPITTLASTPLIAACNWMKQYNRSWKDVACILSLCDSPPVHYVYDLDGGEWIVGGNDEQNA